MWTRAAGFERIEFASPCLPLRIADQGVRRGVQAGAAQPFDQHETDLAALGFFVHPHQLQIARQPQLGPYHGQPGPFDQPPHSGQKIRRHQAHAHRQIAGHHHAAANRLAMQPSAVTEAGFNRVAEGVAEVENRPQALFTLVLADHPGLDLAAALDGIRQGRFVARQQVVEMGFDPAEKGFIGNRAVLDHLGQPGRQLALRQGVERVQIGNHTGRLVKRANHVLAQWMVDRRLATDR